MFFRGILLVLLAAECYSQSDSKSASDRLSQPEYINETSGWIASPNYPGNYGNNLDFQWLITSALPNEVVNIYFTDYYTVWCCDYVDVHDGDNIYAWVIFTGYGNSYMPLYTTYSTTQPYMLIRLITDGSSTARGFYAVFYTGYSTGSAVSQDTSPTTAWPTSDVTSDYSDIPLACRASYRPVVINNSTGYITSPNFPYYYYDYLDCQWLISSAMSYEVVSLRFNYFYLYWGSEYVHIYDGSSESSRLIASLTGSPSEIYYTVYTTTQPNMLLKFTSNYRDPYYYAFEAFYWTTQGGTTIDEEHFTTQRYEPSTGYPVGVPLACLASYRPEVINNSTGWIASPNFPGNYYDNLNCQWLIVSAMFYEVISLRFTYFYLENSWDYVYIYDGRYEGDRVIDVLTGSPSYIFYTNYTTTQRNMLLKFTTDRSNTYPGFNATYWTTQADSLTTAQTGFFTTTTWYTTVPTTSQPSAPVIDPRPYVAVKLNGTMTATGSITQSCSDAFSADFRNSFQEVVGRANNLVATGQLCSDGGGPLRIVAGQIQSLFIGTAGQTVFSILVGPNPPDWVTLQTDESCSWQVSDFVRNGNNWRQPIISNIFGCPAVTVDSNSFTWQQSFWDVF